MNHVQLKIIIYFRKIHFSGLEIFANYSITNADNNNVVFCWWRRRHLVEIAATIFDANHGGIYNNNDNNNDNGILFNNKDGEYRYLCHFSL